MKKISSFDGVKINYDLKRLRSDYFLIFIHGAGGNLTAWKNERQFFHNKGISTLAVDLRGHGLSDRPEKAFDYRLESFAHDLNSVLAEEKIDNFIIVAHCFGGMVAMSYQQLYPNLAKAFIFVDTASKAPNRLRAFMLLNFPILPILNYILKTKFMSKKDFEQCDYRDFAKLGDWNMKRMYADITHTSLRSWIYTYQNMANFDGREVLKEIKVPTLVIHGDRDKIFGVDKAREINKLISESVLDILPGTNHIIVLSAPEILSEKILNFVEKLK